MASLFDPVQVRGMRVKNRVALSPMLMYEAGDDGILTETQFVHYGARIIGGVGLLTTEVLAVTPAGRISNNDLGIWSDGQAKHLERLTAFARQHDVRTVAQLAHAGRKSTAQQQGVAPSAIAYGDYAMPEELSVQQIADIVGLYVRAAMRAIGAGFDAVELHMCHGYLFHQFLSGASNRREDHYGGSLANRARFPLEAVRAIRAAVPTHVPLIARISGDDLADGGIDVGETIAFAEDLKAAGVDMLVVTTGNIVPGYEGPVFPGYQTPYATRVREAVDLPTGSVGSIASPDLADYVVRIGDADIIYLGRALLDDPFWTLHAQRRAGEDFTPPIATYKRATGPYERGF